MWQQEAVNYLKEGKDVVVHAPTGAGKTYIFELLMKAGFKHQAIYTVPTRALANDKLYEWRRQGWNVGIATGDIAEKTDAPVVVATLETQKNRLLKGEGPGLLVIDEYQMLGDPSRGVNYELAVASAPPGTQLLLLSGSVGNPQKVVSWLRRIGRDAEIVYRHERPVPQDEIMLEALSDRLPGNIRGFWPRFIARALAADFGPILVFAPRRHAAEDLARQLSAALPLPEWLELTPEQKHLAGDPMAKLLRNRIAFHHSGLSYQQRAGLIEPLAKKGQLRVIVATTGLAAGINFCMKSVLVTDREYQAGNRSQLVRPDELLQMFGRAGRRGLDEKGYVLVAPGKPRLNEARPLQLRRSPHIDWGSFHAVMHEARREGESPVSAAESLSERLFSERPVELGLRQLNISTASHSLVHKAEAESASNAPRPKIKEMLNSEGEWERQRPRSKVRLGETLIHAKGRWKNALRLPESLARIQVGNLCKLGGEAGNIYGRQVALAMMPQAANSGSVTLVKWMYQQVRAHYGQLDPEARLPGRYWRLEHFERDLVPLLPYFTQGGKVLDLIEHKGLISARLDYSGAQVFARVDSHGRALINPPFRVVEPPPFPTFAELAGPPAGLQHARSTPAQWWHQLGLIDEHKCPTRRGVIFSFFNHGEGLAIAAALEDESYALEDLLYDLANLRAGHRFEEYEDASARLGNVCRLRYHGLTCPGYLEQGVPPEYGNGAAEVLAKIRTSPGSRAELVTENLRHGDIERALLEWRSILNHICFAPDYHWERWRELKELARVFVATYFSLAQVSDLPELTHAQRQRFNCRLRW
nr:DEAD/DEAH box helicase [Ruficoccus amylovorans]